MSSFDPSQLHVVTAINNPCRFKSRPRLYREYEEKMRAAGVHLVTVEAAFNRRDFEVTESGNPDHIQVVQRDELWLKENLLNLAISHLPSNWEYVAWVDGDVEFARKDWAVETIHQLQHFAVVQMFGTAIDLDPYGDIIPDQTLYGFGWSHVHHMPRTAEYISGKYYHPGFAWAMNRETFNDVGGLLDVSILGAGDHHMALSYIGETQTLGPSGRHPAYMRHILEWQNRCTEHIKGNVGYVPGMIIHYWHGKKKDRGYIDRWKVLVDNAYNPDEDIKRDWQGVWIFTERGERLRIPIRDYFRSRNEDSIDL